MRRSIANRPRPTGQGRSSLIVWHCMRMRECGKWRNPQPADSLALHYVSIRCQLLHYNFDTCPKPLHFFLDGTSHARARKAHRVAHIHRLPGLPSKDFCEARGEVQGAGVGVECRAENIGRRGSLGQLCQRLYGSGESWLRTFGIA